MEYTLFMHKKVLFVILATIVIFIIVVNQFFRRMQIESVTSTQPLIDNGQSAEEVFEPAKDWEIFSNEEPSFSFGYPQDWKVEERAPGFFVISLTSENVPQAGISVDTRMQGVYKSLEDAVKDINENYTVVSTEKFNEWSMFNVVGKEGMVKDLAFKLALYPYETGVIAVQTINVEPYGDVFSDFVRSFIW